MQLLLIRHGEPDYVKDSLTPKGFIEADLLAERISKLSVDAFYVSPLGRAKDTAAPTLKKMGRTAEECEFLREFAPRIIRPDKPEQESVTWDWMPKDWTVKERFYDPVDWVKEPPFPDANVPKEVEWIHTEFDKLLEKHGYKRNGLLYEAVRPNNDRIVFFCHFALSCVLIGHLLHVSPMILWHGLCAAPTSVSVINTEERTEGIASFRMASYGDISHLYAGNEPASFAARFCSCYANSDERH
ncbi:MAG: histidine phosphatase family protein [Lachnospiraceae bacterium]|nr:histidine phosphatase family protein [Lachnospiraceae bacterium]